MNAQDTVQLKTIEVNTGKNDLFRTGKRTEAIDSMAKEQFRYESVAELLAFKSQVFIKSYGPGSLATTSLRGGNASQTAVLWNGFNLQNAMLGQSDLSLMPSSVFDHIEVEYGGSSALWGSGAVGGSIHLNNKALFAQGMRAGLAFSAGNTGNRNINGTFLFSSKKFVSSTRFYALSSLNNYLFRDTLDGVSQVKKQTHASYNILGTMQELKWITGKYSVLQLNGWFTYNKRQIAGSIYSPQNYGLQNDRAQRISANWSYEKKKYKSVLRSAAFNDVIEYRRNTDANFSASRVLTLMGESENYIRWGNQQLFNFGVAYASSLGDGENYLAKKQLTKLSLLTGNKFQFFDGAIVAGVALRAEHFSNGNSPVTGNLSLDYKPIRQLTLSVSVARIYRQPTLNELFWQPGGNASLKPEEGTSFEGTAVYQINKNRFLLSVSASAYSRFIHNWILWLPGGGGNPSPENVEQVWSRGTETSFKLQYIKRKVKCGVNFSSAYVLSTIQSTFIQNDNSAGKQLIYTPRYLFNGSAFASYQKTFVCFYQQYTGYRFTSSDNFQWLPPYWLTSMRISQRFSKQSINYDLFVACNNLFNNHYSVVAGRPMPLRNFEAGVSINFKKQDKTK